MQGAIEGDAPPGEAFGAYDCPMRNLFLVSSALFLLTLGAGCGSSVVTGTGGTGTGTQSTSTTGTQSTSTGTTSTGTGTPGGCPAAEPTGGSCAGLQDGLECTYGSSVRPECRDQWTCASGQWEEAGTACAMTTTCGTTEPTAGSVCQPSGAGGDVCTYGNTICICDACTGGLCTSGPIMWLCVLPPATPGCPAVAPNEGAPCTSNGLECTYGKLCSISGVETQCTNGVWTWPPVACPA
jgi:hypothetical protein